MPRSTLRWIPIALALSSLLFDARKAGGTYTSVFTFEGFSYEAAAGGGTDPTPGDLLAVGDAYVLVATLTSFGDLLTPHVDPTLNEYTLVITGGTVIDHRRYQTWQNVALEGPVHYRVFADPRAGGTAATVTPNPPNTQVPGSFADGEVVLEATLPRLLLYWNDADGIGQTLEIVSFAGPLSAALYPPVNGKGAYELEILYSLPSTVSGYHAGLTGDLHDIWVDPVEPSSWGALKQRYR